MCVFCAIQSGEYMQVVVQMFIYVSPVIFTKIFESKRNKINNKKNRTDDQKNP